jgi:ribose transport system permease protein
LTMLALPMTLIIMTEGLDLSMGAVLTLTSLCVAIVSLATKSMLLGVGAAILVGAAFGTVNGWLVAILGIPPFVATLGTLGMAQGLSLIVSDGQSVVGIPHSVRDIYSTTVLGVPVPIVMALATYAVFHGMLYHTRFGTYIFALGGNREALKYAGLSPSRLLIAVYALGGTMAGIAGLLMTARMNSGHPTAGLGLEFDAIAAVAVGGTSFERGNGWLLGTVLGVIAVGVLRNGLNLISLPSSVQVASVGVLVIVALFLDGLRSRS